MLDRVTKQFSSVWAREERAPKAPGLSRDQIVRAALELLDAEGIEGLSMRKLGARLNAGATSIYWHVANKDELLELCYDRVWVDVVVLDPETAHWRPALSTFAHSLRSTILRHPWLARVLGRVPGLGPNLLSVSDRIMRLLQRAGFEGLEISFATGTMMAYVMGQTIPEVTWRETMGKQNIQPGDLMEILEKTTADDFPELFAAFRDTRDLDPLETQRMSFSYGLECVLDGLEARVNA